MPEIRCPSCLAELEEKFVFCPYCGSAVPQAAEAAETKNEPETVTEYKTSEGPYFRNAALIRTRLEQQAALAGASGNVMSPDEVEAEKQKKMKKSGGAVLAFALISHFLNLISYMSSFFTMSGGEGLLNTIFTVLSFLSVVALVFAIMALVKSGRLARELGCLTGIAKVGRVLGIIALVFSIIGMATGGLSNLYGALYRSVLSPSAVSAVFEG